MSLSILDHGQKVLAAIVPNRRDLLDRALRHLAKEHFADQTQRNLFVMLERYAGVTGSIMTRSALSDMIAAAGADEGKKILYEETYDLLVAEEVTDAEFLWSLDRIRDLAAAQATGEALTQAMEILSRGAQDDRGRELKGHSDARHHILNSFALIDRELSMQDAPEGDMRLEREEILGDYADRKKAHLQGTSQGILFGIPEIDAQIGGLQPGELDLILGWTSSGKTSCLVQLSWYAAVMQGLNVVFATTETLRAQVRRKIICRHSMLPQFNLPEGIDSKELKLGRLSEEDEAVLQDVAEDFTHNPNYGRVYILQIPRGATMGVLESKLIRIQNQFRVDLCAMDYFQLLRSDRHRSSDREEQSSVVKEGKQLATTFNDGRGLVMVSPWQVNRTSKEQADRVGYYDLASTSETAEASNSADVIVSLLEPPEINSRYVTLRGQVLKCRDGARSSVLEVSCDYATSTFSSKRRAEVMDDLLGGSNSALL